MTAPGNRDRLTVTCTYCDTVNDLTVVDVHEHQEVRCSRCGAPVGNVGQLRDSGDAHAGREAGPADSTAKG